MNVADTHSGQRQLDTNDGGDEVGGNNDEWDWLENMGDDIDEPSDEGIIEPAKEHAIDDDLFAQAPAPATARQSRDEVRMDASTEEQAETDPYYCEPCDNYRVPRTLNAPIKPSAEDVEKHYHTHFPYRNWCPVCVKAKGREDAHPRSRGDDGDKGGLPIISLDYQEFDEEAEDPQRVIIGVDEATGSVFGHYVACKGIGDGWIVKRLVKDIEDIGRSSIILKTDGEPAIVAVQSAIQSARQARTVPRNPPAYNPQANGPCEKAVQDVTGHHRTIKLGLEMRLGVKVDERLPIMQWAFEHASFLITRFSVGKDGMTPLERGIGRKWRRPIVEFGEMVLAKLALRRRAQGKDRKQKRKLAARSIDGVWVGQVSRTGEHLIIKPNGDTVRCRTIKRVPLQHRWNAERVLMIKATPRCPAPSSRKPEVIPSKLADDEDREKVEHAAKAEDIDKTKPDEVFEYPEVRQYEFKHRNFRITERILDKYGYTDNCDACTNKLLGERAGVGANRLHSEACRRRISDAMEKDEFDSTYVERSRQRLEGHGAEVRDDKEERCVSSNPHVDAPVAPGETDRDAEPATPKFENEDEPNTQHSEPEFADGMDEIPELDETDVEMFMPMNDPLEEQKKTFDEEEDEEPEGPSSAKKQRIAPLFEGLRLITATGRAMAITSETAKAMEDLPSLTTSKVVRSIINELESKKEFKVRASGKDVRKMISSNGKVDVAEVYSPPRITKMAEGMGLKAGWALDLTTTDPEDNAPWDFTVKAKREKVMKMLEVDEPFMLITCPMCGAFSQLQELFNYPKLDRSAIKEKLEAAMSHLKFTMDLCMAQHRAGRLFLFEHPSSASSWECQMVKELQVLAGVQTIKFDFCMLGMTTKGKDGETAAAKKSTNVMTNSGAVADLLKAARCRGEHRHEPLLEGRAGPCQRYTEKFCKLVCEGVKRELDTVQWRNRLHRVLDITTPFGKLMNIQEIVNRALEPPDEERFNELYRDCDFYDDVHGGELDKGLATAARRTEIKFFKTMGVYTKVRREAWMRVISTRWIDTNKGDSASPNYRARLVGRELNLCKRDDLFAATPPLESLRMILSICASRQDAQKAEDRFVVMRNDVRRAYFYAPTTRPIFITIPAEDREPGDEDMVGQLNLSLYGTRDAAINWAKTYTEFLVSAGFEAGKASPCNFVHRERSISLTVHGDDFTSTGREKDLRWLDAQMRAKFDIETNIMGPGPRHEKQVRILNRIITWSEDGILYEADQRHAELLIRALDVSKAVTTPGTRDDAGRAGPPSSTTPPRDFVSSVMSVDTGRHGGRAMILEDEYMANILKVSGQAADGGEDDQEGSPLLSSSEASRYRALAARANYLALDRPDVQFAVKEIARRMAKPCEADWILLKRLARYLVGAPRAVLHFEWQSMPKGFDTYVDGDWAGCKKTCRSTSGGAIKHGWHLIKSWATTQSIVALSSGESELYALTKGAAQSLGMASLADDLGLDTTLKLHTDASATIGIVRRRGLGKLRHLNVQYLWLQDRADSGDIDVTKVAGHDNPADLMTKHLAAHDMWRHLDNLGVSIHSDRADSAPQLARCSGGSRGDDYDYDDDTGDDWMSDDIATAGPVRVHRRGRLELFTPRRVRGAPPCASLTPVRITRGEYLDTGEKFKIVDTWTSRPSAHRQLTRRWTGTTRFISRSERRLCK